MKHQIYVFLGNQFLRLLLDTTHFFFFILVDMFLSSLMMVVLVLIEFTTMAGRRLRDAVKTVLTSGGHGDFNNNINVVIAGLTNTYSQYVTTFEEYEAQRYEVSSWVHGTNMHLVFIFKNKLILTTYITQLTLHVREILLFMNHDGLHMLFIYLFSCLVRFEPKSFPNLPPHPF